MRKSLLTVSLTVGLLATPLAQADLVTTWGYTVDSGFTAATFTSGGGTQIVSGTEISWGGDNNGGSSGVGDLIINGGERSGLLIENTPRTGTITTGSLAPQPTNTFSHINNSISADYATLLTASISTTLKLTALDPDPDVALPDDTITFAIKFAETSNNNNCVVGATSNCDDVFVITFGSLNNSFVYDGYEYFASIVKTNGPLDPLSPSACAAAGVASGCLGFLTEEGAKTSVDFGIVITSSPINVPEPASLALLGAGLAGLGFSRRRKV